MKNLFNKISNLNETQTNVLCLGIVLTAIVGFFLFASAVDMNLNNWRVK